MQPSCRRDYNLAPNQRLKSSRLIKEALEQGRRFAGKFMVMWIRTGDDAALRAGVIAGKKTGGAVERNRAKRRLREAFRLNRWRLNDKCDIVLMARDKIGAASWNEVQSELISLAERAGILAKEPK